MPMAKAKKICPQMVIVPPHFSAYREASQKTMQIICDLTGLVEQVSIDEAFLDVSDLPDAPEVIAANLQSRIREELNLPCSLGVASNKLVAKIANNIGKSSKKGNMPPCSIMVVPPGKEASFLANLPVNELWGVGPKTAAKLEEIGIHTIGQLARTAETQLYSMFGKWGRAMQHHARGEDDSPVENSHEVKSISQEVTFAKDISDQKHLEQTLRELSDKVGRQLRSNDLTARTIRLKLRWEDFTTLSRQATIEEGGIDQDNLIYEAARRLFLRVWQPGKKVRLLGVGVSGLQKSIRQLSLWNGEAEKQHRLLSAIDAIHERFGKQVIRRGRVNKDLKGVGS
jgi:DNA polymerase IV